MEAARDDNRTGEQAGRGLARSLEDERELTESLLAVLRQERESLLGGRLEDLYGACRRRGELVERLRSGQEATARAVAELLHAEGGGGRRTLASAIAQAQRGVRPRLRRLQGEVSRLRREVAVLSEENTRYATEALDYLEAALSILTGAARPPETYGGRRARAAAPAHVSSEV